jgi:hypothetical protein
MSRRLLFVLLGLGLALIVVMGAIAATWGPLTGGLSLHGWFAYALGGLLTLGLSAGLFLLTFHSSRSGQDEAASDASERGEDPFRPRD